VITDNGIRASIERARAEQTEPAAWGESGLRPDHPCAWCGLRLAAVPDRPLEWEGAWYHRRGCYPTARMKRYGYLPAEYQPITLAAL